MDNKKKKRTMLMMQVSEELLKKLKIQAVNEFRTVTSLVTELIVKYLEEKK